MKTPFHKDMFELQQVSHLEFKAYEPIFHQPPPRGLAGPALKI